ncbi:hypothetical protein K438DRAFT_1971918 [Mycena galopus ATCC 62051]|nr:hypothetical protein K438DRAFT_1971918 [Mycena galopus ATCC 62051]
MSTWKETLHSWDGNGTGGNKIGKDATALHFHEDEGLEARLTAYRTLYFGRDTFPRTDVPAPLIVDAEPRSQATARASGGAHHRPARGDAAQTPRVHRPMAPLRSSQRRRMLRGHTLSSSAPHPDPTNPNPTLLHPCLPSSSSSLSSLSPSLLLPHPSSSGFRSGSAADSILLPTYAALTAPASTLVRYPSTIIPRTTSAP